MAKATGTVTLQRLVEVTRERDELRAERDAYKQQARDVADQMQTRYLELADMLAAVRQDQERVMTERAELRAEVERLTLADRQWADHFKRLAEENERLRAALNRHRGAWHGEQGTGDQVMADYIDEAIAERLTRERDELRETIAEWQAIHGTFAPSGAPDDVHFACREQIERLRAMKCRECGEAIEADDVVYHEPCLDPMVERLRAALKGVLAEADRKTDAFDRAHAALE